MNEFRRSTLSGGETTSLNLALVPVEEEEEEESPHSNHSVCILSCRVFEDKDATENNTLVTTAIYTTRC